MATNTDHMLLDSILHTEKLKNDTAMAKLLGVQAPQISKIRHGKIPVSDTFRVTLMRKLGWSLKRIDALCQPEVEAQ